VGKDALSSGYNLGIDGVVLSEIQNGEALVHATGAGVPRYETPEPGVPGHPPVAGIAYRGKPLSYFVAQLKQSPQASRADVLRSIAAFGEDAAPAVKELVAALSDANAEVRGAAAWSIAQVGPRASEAGTPLAHLLKDGDVHIRECAALALGSFGKGAATAVPDLGAALKDPAATVRMAAATALGQMGVAAKPAVPQLTAVLQATNSLQMSNEEVQVVRNIAYALGNIGPDAGAAIPALKQIQHLRVKYIAEEAIGKIEGKPHPVWH
jgi:HEAT repeat protein